MSSDNTTLNIEKLSIEKSARGGFDVRSGDYLADGLTFDEMLGCVAQAFMPERRHCLGFLKSPEQRKEFEEWLASVRKSTEDAGIEEAP